MKLSINRVKSLCYIACNLDESFVHDIHIRIYVYLFLRVNKRLEKSSYKSYCVLYFACVNCVCL